MEIKDELIELIKNEVRAVNRPDLLREPVIGFSRADDKRYAELKDIIGPWHELPTDILPSCKTVISYYIPMTQDVALSPKDSQYSSFSWSEAYTLINRTFDYISDKVCAFLNERGYETSGIKTKWGYNSKTLLYEWSNKSAAVISGIGSFGLNRTVITEKGSAVRISTIFTSLEIPPTGEYMGPKCHYLTDGSCRRCVKSCPVHALDDENNFKKFDCQDEQNKNEDMLLHRTALETMGTCGKCIAVCPNCYFD